MPGSRSYRIRAPKATLRGRETFTTQVNSWLIRLCYRALRSGLTFDVETLEEYCWTKISRYTVSTYDTFMGTGSTRAVGAQVSDTQASQIVASVTRFVLTHYDPQTFSRIQAHRARCRRRFYPSHVARLTGQSLPESARSLGCSVSTVSRLRRQLRSTPFGRLLYLLSRTTPKKRNESHGVSTSTGPRICTHPASDRGAVRSPAVSHVEGDLRPAGRDGPGQAGGDPAGRHRLHALLDA